MLATKFRMPKAVLNLEALEDRTLLNAGVPDLTFQPQTPHQGGLGEAVLVQPDGKIVVGGEGFLTSTSFALLLARYNPDGSLDSTFGTGGEVDAPVASIPMTPFTAHMALQADGKIVGVFGLDAVRITSSGALDSTFGTAGLVTLDSLAQDVALQSDGKILVLDAANLDRLNPDGTLDVSFGTGGQVKQSGEFHVAVEPNGRILLAGSGLTRLNADGSTDATFGVGGQVPLPFNLAGGDTDLALAVQADGRIVVASDLVPPGQNSMGFDVTRFDVNGSIDATFGAAGFATTVVASAGVHTHTVRIQADGKIVVFATGSNSFGPFVALARYNPNGAQDTTFGNSPDGLTLDPRGSAISDGDAALQADGSIIAVSTTEVSSLLNLFVTRYTADTPISDPDQRFLNQVYLDLLQRPVDPGGLSAWSGAMQAGMTRTQVIAAIEGSTEYRTDEIQNLYALLLNRAADPGGLNAWLSFLNQGHTANDVEAQILGSNEYFAGRGGSSNTTFLQRLYGDVLGRPLDSTGAQVWGQQLANGISRTQVAAAVLGSTESDMDEVELLYPQYLRRPADPGGLAGFTGMLQQGASVEAIRASIIGSDEYVGRLFS